MVGMSCSLRRMMHRRIQERIVTKTKRQMSVAIIDIIPGKSTPEIPTSIHVIGSARIMLRIQMYVGVLFRMFMELPSNENKMSGGERGRAPLEVFLLKSSQKWSVQRSAVRSIRLAET